MYVIFSASDGNGLHVVLAGDTANERPEALL
jgi:hypothetical protein